MFKSAPPSPSSAPHGLLQLDRLRLPPTTALGLTLLLLLVVLLPIIIASWLAEQHVRARERAALQQYAERGLRNFETVVNNAIAALDALQKQPDPLCSDGWRQAARHTVVRYRYVQVAMALSEQNTVLCDSMATSYAVAPLLGKPDWRGPRVRVWISVPDPEGAGRKMVVLAAGQNGVLVDPESMIDVVSDRSSYSLGIVGLVYGQVISAWPYANREALRQSYFHPGVELQDGRFHVVARSATLPVAVIASEPEDELLQRWTAALRYWLPAGLASGMLAAWGFLRVVRRHLSFEGQLRQAVRKNQFEVHYQPIVDLHTRRCVGAEALVRWRQSNGQLVRPDLFIPLAEESGLIQPLTDLVLEHVCAELGPTLLANPTLYISINVAAIDLASSRFADELAHQMADVAFAPSQIAIEATERGFMHANTANEIIQKLRSAGHPVLIDDFGTGYSSLSYLQHFQVDTLKIDKAFIDTVGTEAASASVAPHIVEIGHSLGVKLVAEGVESEDQALWLSSRGVQYGQGWLFARAMPRDDFLAWLAGL